MVIKTPQEEHNKLKKYNTEDWLYEDFKIGEKVKSISRTISEGEAMLFNSLVLDMHPYVGDQEFAENEGMFGKRLVAGAQVFSYGLGLMANNNVNTFSYGYDKLRFIKPVFIGDTIYTVRTNKMKKPRNPDIGIITVSYEVFKNQGELVLYAEHLQTVRYRDPTTGHIVESIELATEH